MKTETVNPNVANFIESLRDIGYSTEVAVADLIDNSITANSSNIQIYTVAKPTMIFCLLDNGTGMSQKELVEAMRLASKNPNNSREKNDLGRFGLGLKTSSFSQCKKLTVISKKNGKIVSRQWDLTYISIKNKWLLISPVDISHLPLFSELKNKESGTLIVWENIDRVNSENFSGMIDRLRKHLSLVFHKFLEGTVPFKKLKISINNNPIEPFNPFNHNHPAT
ncbi:MAG: ATP-binding protein [Adhaeribacter sp.]